MQIDNGYLFQIHGFGPILGGLPVLFFLSGELCLVFIEPGFRVKIVSVGLQVRGYVPDGQVDDEIGVGRHNVRYGDRACARMTGDVHVVGGIAVVKHGPFHRNATMGRTRDAEGGPAGDLFEEIAEFAVLAGQVGV